MIQFPNVKFKDKHTNNGKMDLDWVDDSTDMQIFITKMQLDFSTGSTVVIPLMEAAGTRRR